MIDIQDKVFTILYNYMNPGGSDEAVGMTTDISLTPARFPHIAFVELSNTNYEDTIDSGSNENHCQIMYQVEIYTKGKNRMSSARELCEKLDKKLLEMGFRRTSMTPDTSFEEYYRLIVRYEGIVSQMDDNTNYVYVR